MAGLVEPSNFPVRDPKDAKQVNGRIVNPVRYPEIGGLSGPGKMPGGNQMAVEKPTGVRGAKPASRRNG